MSNKFEKLLDYLVNEEMDKANELHSSLEVEVFKANAIGRKFYSKYGFELLEEKHHESTGQPLLRLRFVAG